MEKLITIKTVAQLPELVAYLKDAQFVAFDTETTGVEKDSHIIGFSVSADTETGYYVVLSYWDVEAQKLVDLETKEHAKAIYDILSKKCLIMHNAIFDCIQVKNNSGVDLMPALHTDTMILAHVTDENRSCALKELAAIFWGEDSRIEQNEMKESVTRNGGMLTRTNYELYKGDADLIAKYGAKDTILTMKLFYQLVPDLYDQGLDKFFYEEESMPLLKGPTYDLNTTGLRIDQNKLSTLRATLEAECLEARAFIDKETAPLVTEKYPGTKPTNTFNVNASTQLAWLLFDKLDNEFNTLTEGGRELCKALDLRLPYAAKDKREFIRVCRENKDRVYMPAKFNPKTGKMGRPKKVGDFFKYTACGKETLKKLENKYKWVKTLLEYKSNDKILTTYVLGIQERMKYNIINPNFLQHGTTSGRYSCKNPNFQNLPRSDKRVKSCIVPRPGKVFVGSDYSQLEPRVFASVSKDERLLASFKSGDDFYSVIGMEVFDKYDCTPMKDGSPNAFGVKYPHLRDIAKVVALSATYGTTAPKMALAIGKSRDEAQEVIDTYFERFPSVQKMMLSTHESAKNEGVVYSLYGRPRRMPMAKDLKAIYGNTPHVELPYEARQPLNLAVNHTIQSTGASIMNRAAVECHKTIQRYAAHTPLWSQVKIVLQIHDELILEGPEALKNDMIRVLKEAMENTTTLPGVDLIAEPKAGYSLAELK